MDGISERVGRLSATSDPNQDTRRLAHTALGLIDPEGDDELCRLWGRHEAHTALTGSLVKNERLEVLLREDDCRRYVKTRAKTLWGVAQRLRNAFNVGDLDHDSFTGDLVQAAMEDLAEIAAQIHEAGAGR